jgi:hypothetical protein
MRQVGDTLVWLAMITVVVAVVYFTPRVASYVALFGSEHGGGCVTCRDIAYHPEHSTPVQTR